MNAPGESESTASPRAFVTATGFIFQTVGLMLTFGGCCLWSFSGLLQDASTEPVQNVQDYLSRANAPRTVAMVATVVTFLGGLALLATGIGLQGERPTSGRRALWATGVLVTVWWGSVLVYLLLRADLWKCLASATVALLSTVLFLLAGNSARILKLHPPPADQNVITAEELEQYRRHGHE